MLLLLLLLLELLLAILCEFDGHCYVVVVVALWLHCWLWSLWTYRWTELSNAWICKEQNEILSFRPVVFIVTFALRNSNLRIDIVLFLRSYLYMVGESTTLSRNKRVE